jgi:hypothetical protein
MNLPNNVTGWEARGTVVDDHNFARVKSLRGIALKMEKLKSQHFWIVVIGKNNGDANPTFRAARVHISLLYPSNRVTLCLALKRRFTKL